MLPIFPKFLHLFILFVRNIFLFLNGTVTNNHTRINNSEYSQKKRETFLIFFEFLSEYMATKCSINSKIVQNVNNTIYKYILKFQRARVSITLGTNQVKWSDSHLEKNCHEKATI